MKITPLDIEKQEFKVGFRGYRVAELPVVFRYREDPSTFKILRHGWLLLRDLARLPRVLQAKRR